MMHRSRIREGWLAAAVLMVTASAEAKPGTAPPAPAPGPQTITFTNATQVAIPCSMPGASFTLAPSSSEIRQVTSAVTVTCNGASFNVDRPVAHHLVRCSVVKGGGTGCSEVDPPSTPPGSTVVIENVSNVDLECLFPNNVVIGAPRGTTSSRRAASGTGTCGAAGGVVLAPNILVHTVRCVSQKKGGPQCYELPIAETSVPAEPPPPPPARVSQNSPRIVSTAPVALYCRASLSETGSSTDWINVPAQGEVAFPFADVKEDLLTVECHPPDWKRTGVETVVVTKPHKTPTVIQCVKGDTAAAIVCKAK